MRLSYLRQLDRVAGALEYCHTATWVPPYTGSAGDCADGHDKVHGQNQSFLEMVGASLIDELELQILESIRGKSKAPLRHSQTEPMVRLALCRRCVTCKARLVGSSPVVLQCGRQFLHAEGTISALLRCPPRLTRSGLDGASMTRSICRLRVWGSSLAVSCRFWAATPGSPRRWPISSRTACASGLQPGSRMSHARLMTPHALIWRRRRRLSRSARKVQRLPAADCHRSVSGPVLRITGQTHGLSRITKSQHRSNLMQAVLRRMPSCPHAHIIMMHN